MICGFKNTIENFTNDIKMTPGETDDDLRHLSLCFDPKTSLNFIDQYFKILSIRGFGKFYLDHSIRGFGKFYLDHFVYFSFFLFKTSLFSTFINLPSILALANNVFLDLIVIDDLTFDPCNSLGKTNVKKFLGRVGLTTES